MDWCPLDKGSICLRGEEDAAVRFYPSFGRDRGVGVEAVLQIGFGFELSAYGSLIISHCSFLSCALTTNRQIQTQTNKCPLFFFFFSFFSPSLSLSRFALHDFTSDEVWSNDMVMLILMLLPMLMLILFLKIVKLLFIQLCQVWGLRMVW